MCNKQTMGNSQDGGQGDAGAATKTSGAAGGLSADRQPRFKALLLGGLPSPQTSHASFWVD